MSPLSKICSSTAILLASFFWLSNAMALPGAGAMKTAMLGEGAQRSEIITVGSEIHLGFGGLSGYSEYDARGGLGRSSDNRHFGLSPMSYSDYRRYSYSPSYRAKPKAQRPSRYKRSRFKRRISIRPR